MWTDDQAPRIWRCPESNFYGDEPRDVSQIYTQEVLSNIQAHGFNGIWLRGRLYELMHSTFLPQLNNPDRDQRIESLRDVIQRGEKQGVGVYLFFNEPLALPADHPLWQSHPQLADARGAIARNFSAAGPSQALCTSMDFVQQFFRQAVQSLLDALPGLAGVIQITASENFSHCWSHTRRFSLNDGVEHHSTATIPDCPRCAEREPADVVLDLLRTWRDVARDRSPACRVLAWNWSWSMWYPDPQAPIVSQLPEGVDLLIDWERGGTLERDDAAVLIDEYSLTYPGPSERFTTSQSAARPGSPVYAKLQIGTTHELATVPNLPLIGSLHAKLAGMTRHDVAGFMACWNFGCSLTLNSFAVHHFLTDPDRYQDADVFLQELAQAYFGIKDATEIVEAWRCFGRAFDEHYPFSIIFLYWSPINDAPAHPLSLQYKAQRLGPSWMPHDFGDNPTNCLDGNTTIDHLADCLQRLARQWREAMPAYERALADTTPIDNKPQATHREQELRCARMIGYQLQSTANYFHFHQRRTELIKDSDQPCTLPADRILLEIMQAEHQNAAAALPLVEADPRLGMHQESHVRMYSPQLIRDKLNAMQYEITHATYAAPSA